MKVQILASNKFHFLQLSLQLKRFRKLDSIILGVNKSRNNLKHELKGASIHYLFSVNLYTFFLLLNFLYQKLNFFFPKFLKLKLEYYIFKFFSNAAKKYLKKDKILIANSSYGLESGIKIKKEGGIFICDRGAAHILEQDKILRKEHKKFKIKYNKISKITMSRELEEYALSDYIVVPSKFVKNSFTKHGVDNKKIFVNHLGVDLKKFTPTRKYKTNNFKILFVGGITLQKGIFYLLDAFNNLNITNKKLTLIGKIDPTIRYKIKKYLNDKIRIIKKVDNHKLKYYYSNSDVFVLPSVQDGFGMVATEALACGCPVITTSNTGVADLIKNQKIGFVVKPFSYKEILKKLILLAKKPELKKKISLNAIDYTKKIQGWSSYGKNWNEKIERLKN